MREEKVQLFTPFKDMVQGFEIMLPLLEKIKDSGLRSQTIICYGQLTSTYNEMVNEINEAEEILKKAKAHLNWWVFL